MIKLENMIMEKKMIKIIINSSLLVIFMITKTKKTKVE